MKSLYLAIHYLQPDEGTLLLLDEAGSVYAEKKVEGSAVDSRDALVDLDVLLKNASVTPAEIKGIIVATGPGHFSVLRSAIVMANTSGYAMNVPVVGLEMKDYADRGEFIRKGIEKLKAAPAGVLMVPAYGKEPNITMKKAP